MLELVKKGEEIKILKNPILPKIINYFQNLFFAIIISNPLIQYATAYENSINNGIYSINYDDITLSYKHFSEKNFRAIIFKKEEIINSFMYVGDCNASVININGKKQLITANHCIEKEELENEYIHVTESNSYNEFLEKFTKASIISILNKKRDLYIGDNFDKNNYFLIDNLSYEKRQIDDFKSEDISSIPFEKLLGTNLTIAGCYDKNKRNGECLMFSGFLITIGKKGNNKVGLIYVHGKSTEKLKNEFDVKNQDNFDGLSGSAVYDENGKIVGVFSGVCKFLNNINATLLIISFI